MDKKIAKKTIILYVLDVLRKYSSQDHPVSQSALAMYLNDIGIPCDRKTVGRNIGYLVDYGYKIVKIEGKGFYLTEDKKESK